MAGGAEIHILGVGEAFDTGLGNNSCLLVGAGARSKVPTLLLDCGYQIPERLWARPAIYPRLDGIYLTHAHADHAFGLVPLLARFWEEKRTRPLWIIGPPGVKTYLAKIFALGYPNLYSKLTYELKFLEAHPARVCKWNSLELRFAPSTHSVKNFAVRVDHASAGAKWSFGVSGDGQITSATQALFDDVDILLQEVYSRGPRAPIHCDLRTLARFVRSSSIRRHIGVTHHHRNERRRIHQAVGKLKQRDPRWLALEPGMVIGLG